MKRRKTGFLISITGLAFLVVMLAACLSAFGPQEGNAAAAEMRRFSVEPESVFTDYTETQLKDEYRDMEALSRVRETLGEETYSRAADVLRGDVKYTARREFSTAYRGDRKIDQAGDVAEYSKSVLKCIWASSDLILTGIYGLTDDTITVFVQAEQEEKLPSVIFTQNHGYYADSEWRREYPLHVGRNVFQYPDFVSASKHISQSEVKGGAIYLDNPYYAEEQGRVDVYIEGGGYYPVLRKGGDEEQFLHFLEEYETARGSDPSIVDMAELVTDHAIITTTSSSLYDVYFHHNAISPTENLILWGNYLNTIFEFNGIPVSEHSALDIPYDERNEHVNINFRYMTVYANSGAYSYDYHIGFYHEHEWFADFYHAKDPLESHALNEHYIFGIGHELGHALDVEPRKINETTNNLSAAVAYFKIVGMPHYEQYQPFNKTFKALSDDYELNYRAYDDGKIMYTSPGDYDHNYLIWWDLEAAFPGYWARLNNYFRGTLPDGLDTAEQYVYFSSLATGTDLSAYFERWGFYYAPTSKERGERFVFQTSSEAFKAAMRAAEERGLIAKKFDRFWYADEGQYDFMQKNRDVPEGERAYRGGTPSIVRVDVSSSGRTLYLESDGSADRLGYEVLSKDGNGVWKTAGFTYTSSFFDDNSYDSVPRYKVIAVNRFFRTSEASAEAVEGTGGEFYPCRIGNRGYPTLLQAMIGAKEGDTIFLLSDCNIESYSYLGNKKFVIETDPALDRDVRLYVGKSYWELGGGLELRGRDGARIVIDGKSNESQKPVIRVSGRNFTAEQVVFANLRTNGVSAPILSVSKHLELSCVAFVNCRSARAPAVLCGGKVRLCDCSFGENGGTDLYLENADDLELLGRVGPFTLDFAAFTGEKRIAVEGDAEEALSAVVLANAGYTLSLGEGALIVSPASFNLTFYGDGPAFCITVHEISFVFGSEKDYGLAKDRYIKYIDMASGREYVTGDEIRLEADMSFSVEEKEMAALKIFYNGTEKTVLCPQGRGIYLPFADPFGNAVVAYRSVREEFGAGQIYTPAGSTAVTAMYRGSLSCRFIVRDEIYKTVYGKYGQSIPMERVDSEDFMGWILGEDVLTDALVLKGDTDLFAAFASELDLYDLAICEVETELPSYVFTGEEIVPGIVVRRNGVVVPENCYKAAFRNNILSSSRAEIVLTSVYGKSVGEKTVLFTILPRTLTEEDIVIENLQNFVYDGRETAQRLSVVYGGVPLAEQTDYTVAYSGDRVNAGRVEVTLGFIGNYCGSVTVCYVIEKAERTAFSVTQSGWVYGETPPSVSASGCEEEGEIVCFYAASEDGEYFGEMPVNAGDYWVKAVIAETKNFMSAEAKAPFTILRAAGKAEVTQSGWTYGERAVLPRILSGTNDPASATVEYAPSSSQIFSADLPVQAGDYLVRVTLRESENYLACSATAAFTIVPKDIAALSVVFEESNFVYNGHKFEPAVKLFYGQTELNEGADYVIMGYENNRNAGEAAVLLEGRGNYAGTARSVFTIAKAEKPTAETAVHVRERVKFLSEIELPADFEWVDGTQKVSAGMTASAVYRGADAANYETTVLNFELIFDADPRAPYKWAAAAAALAVVAVAAVAVCRLLLRKKRGK